MSKVYTNESLIKALREIIAQGWIKNRRGDNHWAPWNMLENLLWIKENNLPLPDAGKWELKSQRKNTTSLITLLHKEPSPATHKFVPQIFLPHYGWSHKQAGLKYPASEMSFRQTIHSNAHSDRGFKVQIDKENQRVSIVFDASKISEDHAEWRSSVESRIGLWDLNPAPYWSFEDITIKVGTKLWNCFYVVADTKKEAGEEYFRYERILMCSGLNLEGFFEWLKSGRILVDFDARTGHNHGSKFRMRQNYWTELYAEVVDVTTDN